MSETTKKVKDFCRRSKDAYAEAYAQNPAHVFRAMVMLGVLVILIATLIFAVCTADRPGKGRSADTRERAGFLDFPEGEREDHSLQRHPSAIPMDDAETDGAGVPAEEMKADGGPAEMDENPAGQEDAEAFIHADGALSLPELCTEVWQGLRDPSSYAAPQVRQTLVGLAAVILLALIAAILAVLTVVLILKNCAGPRRGVGKISRTEKEKEDGREENPKSLSDLDACKDVWGELERGRNIVVYGDTAFLSRVSGLALRILGERDATERVRYYDPASAERSDPLTLFSHRTIRDGNDAWLTAKALSDHLDRTEKDSNYYKKVGIGHMAEVILMLAGHDAERAGDADARICNPVGLATVLCETHGKDSDLDFLEGCHSGWTNHFLTLDGYNSRDQLALELTQAPVIISRFAGRGSLVQYLGTEPYEPGTLMLVDTSNRFMYEADRPVIEASLSGMASAGHKPFTVADNALLEYMYAQLGVTDEDRHFIDTMLNRIMNGYGDRAGSASGVTEAAREFYYSRIPIRAAKMMEMMEMEMPDMTEGMHI